MSDFSNMQSSLDRMFDEYDKLRFRGVDRIVSAATVAVRFGLDVNKVVALAAKREAGTLDKPGHTTVTCVGTPTGLAGTA